jgi:uncharacterized protein (TIGR03086 family)
MTFIDLEPAAGRMRDLLHGVPTTALDNPTPCAKYRVGDLLDHIAGLTVAFTDAATKATLDREGPPPPGDAEHLDPMWRDTVPRDLDALVAAWRAPEALMGMTKAGGIDLPAEIAAIVALEELVVHGWDLARATGQPFMPSDDELHAVISFCSQFPPEARGNAYADPVAVGSDASLLDQAVALTGRDPNWSH